MVSQPSIDEADLASAPLGDLAAGMLLATFQDAYRQEIGAEEDVHRTLPFFATALGFIVAALNYAAGQLPSWDNLSRSCPRGGGVPLNHHMLACDWPVMTAVALLVASAAFGIGTLAYLAAATRRRGYRRVGREPAQIERARDLLAFHASQGLAGNALDKAVLLDLRQQVLDDLAMAVSFNRDLTLSRYAFRARAVAFLLASLLLAMAATMLVLVIAKTGFLIRGMT